MLRISLANAHIASYIFFVLSVDNVRSTRSFSMSPSSDRISSIVRGISLLFRVQMYWLFVNCRKYRHNLFRSIVRLAVILITIRKTCWQWIILLSRKKSVYLWLKPQGGNAGRRSLLIQENSRQKGYENELDYNHCLQPDCMDLNDSNQSIHR